MMGDPKAKARQSGNKPEIVELPLENITKISSGINFSMALND